MSLINIFFLVIALGVTNLWDPIYFIYYIKYKNILYIIYII
jgi:hypothetical protein